MGAPNHAKRALILSKWAEYKAKMESVGAEPVQAQFVRDSQGTEWQTSIGTLRNHLGLNPSRPRTDPHLYDSTNPAPMMAIPDSPEAIKQQMQNLSMAYKASLKKRISTLEADIESLEAKLKHVRSELAALDQDEPN